MCLCHFICIHTYTHVYKYIFICIKCYVYNITLYKYIIYNVCKYFYTCIYEREGRERFIWNKWFTFLGASLLAILKFASQSGRLETQERADCAARVWRQCGDRTPPLWGKTVFSIKPSVDWLRTTHIIESNQLYSKPAADINTNHFKNVLSQRHLHWLGFDQISGYLGLANLTQKINHNTQGP